MSVTGNRRIIYAVDVAPQLVTALAEILAPLAIGVRSFSGRARLVEMLRRSGSAPACVLLACDLSVLRDRQIVNRLTKAFADLPVIILADKVTRKSRDTAVARGAADVVESSMMAPYVCQRVLDVLDDPGELAHVQPGMIELAGHANIIMRPVRTEDAQREAEFLRQLSRSGVSQEFFASEGKLSSMPPASRNETDLTRPATLVAVLTGPGPEKIIGMARFAAMSHDNTASFGVATLDEWRGKGIGTQLLRGLIATAATAGVRQLHGLMLKDNASMVALARQLGFDLSNSAERPDTCEVSKVLRVNKSKRRASAGTGQGYGQHPAARIWSKLVAICRVFATACRNAAHKLVGNASNQIDSS